MMIFEEQAKYMTDKVKKYVEEIITDIDKLELTIGQRNAMISSIPIFIFNRIMKYFLKSDIPRKKVIEVYEHTIKNLNTERVLLLMEEITNEK